MSVQANNRLINGFILAGMVVGMALIYRTVSLPWIGVGLAIFGLLALLRPALALLFVPLVVPWYLSPVYIPDIRAKGTVLPLAEVLLLVVFAATVVRSVFSVQRSAFSVQRSAIVWAIPYALFLLAGVLGVVIAIERAPALRDFRWMVVEPLLFYGLVRWFAKRDPAYSYQIALALVVSGTVVAVLGLLQFVGINLVPVLLSPTKSFADEIVLTNGLWRVTSVYGHPNNLGLFLGRVWPVALALAAFAWVNNRRLVAVAYGMGAVLCVAGIAASLSRGAWLGAAAAVAVLLVGFAALKRPTGAVQQRSSFARLALGAALLITVAVVGGIVISLRGGLTGGSTDVRLLFWWESLQLIARHPLGIGLDQYYYYHNPEFGRNLIPATAMEQSEWYARHPHNLFFELWLLLTPFGLAAVAWLLVRFFRNGMSLMVDGGRWTVDAHWSDKRQAKSEAQEPGVRGQGSEGKQRAINNGQRTMDNARHHWLALGAMAAMAAALTHGLVDSFYFWPDLALAFWLLLALATPVAEGSRTEKAQANP